LRHSDDWATIIMPITAAIIFVCAPLLLRRILPTQSLVDSPIRRRLENLCRRAGIRYRDILVWKTDCSLGNAMVMGLFPQVRYILISDLLLERMTDPQIEAVFAHEMGHVVHRHLWWYVAYIVVLIGLLGGPVQYLENLAAEHLPQSWLHMQGAQSLSNLIDVALAMGVFLITFTFFSQRLERQADVFSARMMQLNSPQMTLTPPLSQTYVGEYGAALVASALHEVAVINRMPVRRGNFLHGSIQSRMNYLLDLSADQSRTPRFDKTMQRLFLFVVVTLVTFGVWATLQNL
jgi:STE24 endopeptidase